MGNFIKYGILLIFLSVLFSCNQSQKKGYFTSDTSGKLNEILVVCNETLWNGQVGEKIRETLQGEFPALPQPEPYFDLVQIRPEAFNSTFQKIRNILVFKISADTDSVKSSVQKDVYGKPQTIITITARDENAMIKFIEKNGDKITQIFDDVERNRLLAAYSANPDPLIKEKLRTKFQVKMSVPKGYSVASEYDSLIWISSESTELGQHIYLYYYDYEDVNAFTLNNLIKKRNEVLKQIPGPNPGTYLTTETGVMPEYKQFTYNNNYYAEIRGLWKIEGYFMGGPFVSLSTIDKKRNRVITVEAVLFAPKFNKRNYLKQMEAILYSLETEK